jgi:hypothetical protein
VDFFKSCLTDFGAALARFSADPAVLVLIGVAAALVTASPTRFGAGPDSSSKSFDIGSGAPGGHRSRGCANVGAVEIEANALPEIGDHLFRQARIRTRRAGLGAIIRLFDELQEPVGRVALNVGVGAYHLANMHFASSWMSLSAMQHTPSGYSSEVRAEGSPG